MQTSSSIQAGIAHLQKLCVFLYVELKSASISVCAPMLLSLRIFNLKKKKQSYKIYSTVCMDILDFVTCSWKIILKFLIASFGA